MRPSDAKRSPARMTIYDALPYFFALLAGFFAGVMVGVWLCLTDRIRKVVTPVKILGPDGT